ncbi:nucleotidyltransferase family protein [Bifidobacterium pseudolongum]|uniref:nucleotidyltransferase family protein n=1 Tax=Bifidobacterium pseudolongum TaxID=1694 RepID=UPI0013ECB2EA|nr:nucleotidyltransferase domain-containing protein [Bifidobacterium pseudolongum]
MTSAYAHTRGFNETPPNHGHAWENQARHPETLTPERITSLAAPIARAYGIQELYLFGSTARGATTSTSDVDFIYATPTAGFSTKMLLPLRQELSAALGHPVDLVRKSYLTSPLKDYYSEFARRAFVHDASTNPMIRIV